MGASWLDSPGGRPREEPGQAQGAPGLLCAASVYGEQVGECVRVQVTGGGGAGVVSVGPGGWGNAVCATVRPRRWEVSRPR